MACTVCASAQKHCDLNSAEQLNIERHKHLPDASDLLPLRQWRETCSYQHHSSSSSVDFTD